MPVGVLGFGVQHAEGGHLVIPLDQRGDGAGVFEYLFVELPHRVIDGRAMVIDQ